MRSVRGLVVGSHLVHDRPKRGPPVVGFGNGCAARLLGQVPQPEQRIGTQCAFRRFRSTGLHGRYLAGPASHLLRAGFPGSPAEVVAPRTLLVPSYQALWIDGVKANVGTIRRADQVSVLLLDYLRYEHPRVEIQNDFASRELRLRPH